MTLFRKVSGNMTDTDLYIQRLLDSNPLREPLLREIIQSLELPRGSHDLDAGCGIGLQTLLLLDAVGSDGHVTGLDILPELLAYGTATVAKAGLSDRITFREGDVNHLPFDDNTFDWVWSADCIGYPLLEARLNGTCSGYLPFLKDKNPETNFMRASHWFQRAGLKNITAQTFVSDIQAPLDDALRTALTSLFDMLWGEPQPDVSVADWTEFQRLCKPTSEDFILNLPEYYGFFTCTLFRSVVDEASLRAKPETDSDHRVFSTPEKRSTYQ